VLLILQRMRGSQESRTAEGDHRQGHARGFGFLFLGREAMRRLGSVLGVVGVAARCADAWTSMNRESFVRAPGNWRICRNGTAPTFATVSAIRVRQLGEQR